MHVRRGLGGSSPSSSSQPRSGSAGSIGMISGNNGSYGAAPRQQAPSEPMDGGMSAAGGTPAAGSNLVFCVSPALFETTGVLLPSAPWTLTMQMIARVRQECSTSTTITMSDWRDIAVNILGMKEVYAVSIFDVFSSLPQPFSKPESRLEGSRVLLGKMSGVVDESKWPQIAAGRVASLPGLTMFLMAQLLLERPPRAAAGEVNAETLLTFVKQHLNDFVSAVAVTKAGRVAPSDIQELQLLLREVANGVEQPFGTNLGFLWTRTEKTVDVAVLSQFLRPRIVLPSDVRPQGFPNAVVVRNIVSSVHILAAPMAAAAASPNNSSRLSSATFKVTKCSQTNFYVTSELPNTMLSQLSHCHVALGPVAGVLCVDRCENVTVSALCGSVVVSNCHNVTLCICSNSPPVLGEGVVSPDDVRFAPYNSHYSTLEEHLNTSGVNPKLNLWRCGIPPAMHLPPSEFTSVSFPIAPQAVAVVTTRTNPCVLPKAYQDALNARVQRFQQVTSTLQQAYRQLEAAGRKDLADGLRQKVHTMYLDWLYENGLAKSLVDLLHQSTPTAAIGVQK